MSTKSFDNKIFFISGTFSSGVGIMPLHSSVFLKYCAKISMLCQAFFLLFIWKYKSIYDHQEELL